jgi:hypothetical protein
MTAVECRGMWLRMSRVHEGDAVSEAFALLPAKSRERLLEYLIAGPGARAARR